MVVVILMLVALGMNFGGKRALREAYGDGRAFSYQLRSLHLAWRSIPSNRPPACISTFPVHRPCADRNVHFVP